MKKGALEVMKSYLKVAVALWAVVVSSVLAGKYATTPGKDAPQPRRGSITTPGKSRALWENGSVATTNMLVADKHGNERIVGVRQGEDPKKALGTAVSKDNRKKIRASSEAKLKANGKRR